MFRKIKKTWLLAIIVTGTSGCCLINEEKGSSRNAEILRQRITLLESQNKRKAEHILSFYSRYFTSNAPDSILNQLKHLKEQLDALENEHEKHKAKSLKGRLEKVELQLKHFIYKP